MTTGWERRPELCKPTSERWRGVWWGETVVATSMCVIRASRGSYEGAEVATRSQREVAWACSIARLLRYLRIGCLYVLCSTKD